VEELLRFVAIRAAQRIPTGPDGQPVIRLDTESAFRSRLGDADEGERAEIAKQFTSDDRFLRDPSDDPVSGPLLSAMSRVAAAAQAPEPALSAARVLRAAVREASPDLDEGEPDTAEGASIVLGRAVESWQELHDRLKDSLLALALHQPEGLHTARPHRETLRLMLLAQRLSDGPGVDADVPAALQAVTTTELVLSGGPGTANPDPGEPTEPDRQGDQVVTRVRNLADAADFLITTPRSYLEEVVDDQVTEVESPSIVEGPDNSVTDDEDEPSGTQEAVRSVSYAVSPDKLESARPELRDLITERLERVGTGLDQIVLALRHDERGGVTMATPIRPALLAGTTATSALAATVLTPAVAKVMDSLLNPTRPLVLELPGPAELNALAQPRYGSLGIGELLVVRQRLTGYRALDVAHIENLLRGEKKERLHRRKRVTEETFFTESSTELEEERDTQTSERFELRSEVQEEVKEKTEVEAGVKVTAQLGPFVELEADARFSYDQAKTEGRKRASEYSREVTDKASTRFAEKVLERRERRLVEEVEETNTHTLDGAEAERHISAVYQWVSKVYEAQVYNYGLRQMYEFFLPEPAAFYIATIVQKSVAGSAPTPPPALTISPSNLDRTNYKQYAALYGASGVPAPPEEFVKVSAAQAGGPLDFDSSEGGHVAAAFTVAVPDGYEYFGYRTRSRFSYRGDHDFQLVLSGEFGDPGTVPFFVKGRGIVSWAAWVHLTCRLTASAMDAWRLKTWEAIRDGHAAMQREYEERLAAAAVENGVEITGRNPAANERIVRDEIRRQCLTALADTSPAGNNGVGVGPAGLSVDWAQAYRRGLYVRFMHQAFEWENVSFVFYPFYWARLSRWLELFQIEDVDPQFQAFLQAGMTRVVVPVRPGFGDHVEHFRRTGQIWSGGDAPAVGDPEYVSVAAEIQTSTGAPGLEEPVGQPWEIVLPTALVKVRDDDQLPVWESQSVGVAERIWNGTAHQLGLSSLATDQTTWVSWPSVASWQVPIPAWATEVDINFVLNPAVVTGDVWGELRLDIGGHVTVPTMFDVNYEADFGQFPEQTVLMIGGTHPVPPELRGKQVTVQVQGHMLDPTNHPGHLEANRGCHVNGQLFFKRPTT
jgi:hypothetical protein